MAPLSLRLPPQLSTETTCMLKGLLHIHWQIFNLLCAMHEAYHCFPSEAERCSCCRNSAPINGSSPGAPERRRENIPGLRVKTFCRPVPTPEGRKQNSPGLKAWAILCSPFGRRRNAQSTHYKAFRPWRTIPAHLKANHVGLLLVIHLGLLSLIGMPRCMRKQWRQPTAELETR